MGGKWLKFLLCGRMALRPLLGFNFGFVIKLHSVLLTSCYRILRLNGMFREMLDPPPIKQMVWRIQRCVCAVAERAQLPHPVKYACSVWVAYFCFLVMPGLSGSSEVNKTVSFDKHPSHPRAHALPGAAWFIRVNVTGVWKPLTRLNPFTGLHIHTQTHLHSCTPACALPAHSCKAWNYSCWWWHSLFHQMTHTQHLVNSLLVVCCVPLFWKTFCSVSNCSSSTLSPSRPH